MAIAERELAEPGKTAAEDPTDEDFVPPPYRWTREQFHESGEARLFAGNRVMLIEGEILVMPPIGDRHRTIVTLAGEVLRETFGLGFFVSEEKPFDIGKATDPQPDIAVIQGSIRDFMESGLTEAALIVEVSDSTYAYDHSEKASLYASAGIEDYWIIRLKTREVEVYRQPQPDEAQPFGFVYGEKTIYEGDAIVQPLASALPVAVSALLP